MWRGEQGEAMTKVLSTDNAPFADTDQTRVQLAIGDDSEYRFDNISWIPRNTWNGMSLHLSENSPCIDTGDPDTG